MLRQLWNPNVRLKHYILILLFASIIYLNSLDADFAYDDHRAILDNQDLLSTTPWYHLFINDFWGTAISSSNSHGSYRPITVATFRLNHLIHGSQPFGFHLFNLLLHLVVTFLYTILIEKLLNGHKRITMVASLLFASHPIHVESVTSIVGRADVMAALFYLLAILSYAKFVESNPKGRKYLHCTLIAATLSMLTKEHGITCLMVCFVYHLFILHRFCPFHWQDWCRLFNNAEYAQLRKGIRDITIAFTILMIFRLSIRYRPSFASADNPASDNPSVMVRLLTFYYLPVFNFWLLIYPRWLSFDWSMEAIPLIVSLLDVRNLFTLLFYGVLFGFVRRIFKHYSVVSHEHSKQSRAIKHLAPPPKATTTTKTACSRCCQAAQQNPIQTRRPMIIDGNNNDPDTIDLNNNNVPNYFYETNVDLNNNNNNGVGDYDASTLHLAVDPNNNNIPPPPQQQQQPQESYHAQSNKATKMTVTRKVKKKSGKIRTKLSQTDCFALSLALMVLPFLPATNLFVYVGFVVAERILYIPSFGFCLFIAICIENCLRFSRKFILLKYFIYLGYFVLIISLSIRTMLRNIDWLTEENLYRSGIIINPPKAYGNLANILSSKEKIDEAEQVYKQALATRPNMADVHYNLGLLFQNQARYDEALESYQQALRYRPRLAMAHLNMGAILSRLGDKEQAKQVYQKCSELSNHGLKDVKNHEITRMSALYNLGRLYMDEKNYSKALQTFQQALQQLPSYYPAHSLYNMVGEVHFRLNHTREAEMWFRKSLQSKSDHIPAYLTYAKMLVALNRDDEAEQLYEKAMTLVAPNDSTIFHHYGQFKLKQDKLPEALKIYEKARETFPNDCDIVINMAHILRELARNEEAEQYYRIAVQLRPNDVLTHSNLGAIYHLNGKLDMARKTYLEALRLKPDDNITQINLGKLEKTISKQELNL